MSRTSPISLYVTKADRNRLEREAEEAGMSLSAYIMGYVRDAWDDDDTAAAAARMDAEEKLEHIVADARDELTQITETIEQQHAAQRDMLAIMAKYPIANWEAMKYVDEPPESVRSDAIKTAERRLRKPYENTDADASISAEDEDEDDSSNKDESERGSGYWDRT